MLEGISLGFISLVVASRGMPGMAVVFWYVDQRQTARLIASHKDQLALVLKELRKEREDGSAELRLEREEAAREMRTEREQSAREHRELLDAYRDDVRKVSRMYEDNVLLVKGYQKVTGELVDQVRLNTQTQQMLVDYLTKRTPCHERLKELVG